MEATMLLLFIMILLVSCENPNKQTLRVANMQNAQDGSAAAESEDNARSAEEIDLGEMGENKEVEFEIPLHLVGDKAFENSTKNCTLNSCRVTMPARNVASSSEKIRKLICSRK